MKRFVSLILILVLLCGCQATTPRKAATFYYHRTDTVFQGTDGVFAPELRDVSGARGDVEALVELYCKGPVTNGLESPLPQNTRLVSHTLHDGVLSLQFSSDISVLRGIELTIAAGCLARTFLPLTGADTLVLTSEGTMLGGESAIRITLEELHLRDSSMDRAHQEMTVYYTDQKRRYLMGHGVSVDPGAPEELPMQLLELLLTPPAGSGLRSALPANTTFQSASVEDGLCTVSVSSAFENQRYNTHSGQLLSLMCVVNTLTALDEIDRVEFLVDGQLLIRYGVLSISEPLVRDERCIGPVRTALGERDATLYFCHGQEGLLLPMAVRLRQTGSLSRAELIVRHLMADSGSNGIHTSIPTQTKLNSVAVSNGVCTVDLSAGYLSSSGDPLRAGRVIAASLCTLEEVDKVRILVNGAVPEGYDSRYFESLVPEDDWFL